MKKKYYILKILRFVILEKIDNWRGGRVVEGARLESVYRGNSIMGSNPILSAINLSLFFKGNLRPNRSFKKR